MTGSGTSDFVGPQTYNGDLRSSDGPKSKMCVTSLVWSPCRWVRKIRSICFMWTFMDVYFSITPVPASNRKESPLPSSTKTLPHDCASRGMGDVPMNEMRISSVPIGSRPG